MRKLIPIAVTIFAVALGTGGALAATNALGGHPAGPGTVEAMTAAAAGEAGQANQGGDQGTANQGGDQGTANQGGDQGQKGEDGQSGELGEQPPAAAPQPAAPAPTK
jgi:hypothetical protein